MIRAGYRWDAETGILRHASSNAYVRKLEDMPIWVKYDASGHVQEEFWVTEGSLDSGVGIPADIWLYFASKPEGSSLVLVEHGQFRKHRWTDVLRDIADHKIESFAASYTIRRTHPESGSIAYEGVMTHTPILNEREELGRPSSFVHERDQAAAPSTDTRSGRSRNRRTLETPEARAAAIASGLPDRKLWNVEQHGPFLVGGSNASGGAAVRDTRLPGTHDASGKPECDMTFTNKSKAIAWLKVHHPNADQEGTDEEREAANARIDSHGHAR
jgi:hypothetical protein